LDSEGRGRAIDFVDPVEVVPRVVGKGVAVIEEVGGDPVKRDVEVVDRGEGHLRLSKTVSSNIRRLF
jgi:hypothetical protein